MLETFRNLARSVFGMNHVANHENQYLEIVGNGLDAEHPRNARTLDIAGNEVLAGRLTVGAQPEGDNDVATKKYVDDNAGGLPSVTSDDNGDVLTVVEGAWTKAAPSGGGVLVVGYTESDGILSLDKNYTEIKTAWLSGKQVIFDGGVTGTEEYFPLSSVQAEPQDYAYFVYFGTYEFFSDSATGTLSKDTSGGEVIG